MSVTSSAFVFTYNVISRKKEKLRADKKHSRAGFLLFSSPLLARPLRLVYLRTEMAFDKAQARGKKKCWAIFCFLIIQAKEVIYLSHLAEGKRLPSLHNLIET